MRVPTRYRPPVAALEAEPRRVVPPPLPSFRSRTCESQQQRKKKKRKKEVGCNAMACQIPLRPCCISSRGLFPSLSPSTFHSSRLTGGISGKPIVGSSLLGLLPPQRPNRSARHRTNCHEEKDGPSSTGTERLAENDETQITGLAMTMHQIQDRARIFFAVFFWMSLFFWACAWDGRNNRPPKSRPWFRK
ncbi:uncharacterized protein LOC116255606 [Nymphaea colorata]|nr:uncharacterized protein LOC116255606 [Nymphaea colorata]